MPASVFLKIKFSSRIVFYFNTKSQVSGRGKQEENYNKESWEYFKEHSLNSHSREVSPLE